MLFYLNLKWTLFYNEAKWTHYQVNHQLTKLQERSIANISSSVTQVVHFILWSCLTSDPPVIEAQLQSCHEHVYNILHLKKILLHSGYAPLTSQRIQGEARWKWSVLWWSQSSIILTHASSILPTLSNPDIRGLYCLLHTLAESSGPCGKHLALNILWDKDEKTITC